MILVLFRLRSNSKRYITRFDARQRQLISTTHCFHIVNSVQKYKLGQENALKQPLCIIGVRYILSVVISSYGELKLIQEARKSLRIRLIVELSNNRIIVAQKHSVITIDFISYGSRKISTCSENNRMCLKMSIGIYGQFITNMEFPSSFYSKAQDIAPTVADSCQDSVDTPTLCLWNWIPVFQFLSNECGKNVYLDRQWVTDSGEGLNVQREQ